MKYDQYGVPVETPEEKKARFLRPCAAGCILGWEGGQSTQGGCRHLKATGPEANQQLRALGEEIQRLNSKVRYLEFRATYLETLIDGGK